MEIPFDLFDEITGTGNSATTNDPSDPDRRQHRRLPFGSRGTIAALHGSEEGLTSVVMLRDISIGGIGFLNAEPLKIGEMFAVRFTGQSGRSVKLHCAAQRCDPGGTGATQFVIGATFEKLIEPTEATPREPDGTSAPAELPRPVAALPSVMPTRKSSLFQTPKLNVGVTAQESAPLPVTTSVALVATIAAPVVVAAHQVLNEGICPAPPKLAERSESLVEAAPSVTIEPIPPVEAIASLEVAMPAVQKAAEVVEPMPAAVEPMQALTPAPIPEVSSSIPASCTTSAPVVHAPGLAHGKNEELVAQVKSRFLKQHEVMKTKVQQMEECNRQLAEQKTQLEELGRQRDALHAMFVKAGQQLSEEQERSAREIETLRREVLELRENQQALQAKSESDDRAIAELAALLETEAGLISASGN